MPRAARLLLWMGLVFLATCSSDKGGTGPARYGTVRVTLAATPTTQAEEVWVAVDRVEARHQDLGWLAADDATRDVNLESLAGGSGAILALATLPAGHYTNVRLHLGNTAVMVGGVKQPLAVPAGADGIELASEFDLATCGVVELALSWDVATQLSSSETGYTLQPTLTVAQSADSGGCCAGEVCAGGVCNADACEAGGGEQLILHDSRPDAVSGYYGSDGLSVSFLSEETPARKRVAVSSASGELLVDITWEGDTYRTSLFDGALVTTVDLGVLAESQRLAGLPPDQIPSDFSVSGAITTTGDPALADALVARPEYVLFPYLSRALGAAGFNGTAYPVTLPIHRMGMQAAADLQVDPAAPGSMPRLGTIAAECTDLRSDPNHDECFGLCGPGCSCWEWVCGDCCCHAGCATHDSTCRNCKWYKPWNCVLCATFTSFLAGACGSCGGGPVYEPTCVGLGADCTDDYQCCGYDNGADEERGPVDRTVICEYDSSAGGHCRREGDPPPVFCGDGLCQDPESCSTCSADCGACPSSCNNNGVCDGWPEDCGTCPGDCPCATGQTCAAGACIGCGDGMCDPGENCLTCQLDCGACPPCGDGTCATGEDCSACPADCACPGGQTCSGGICVGCGNGRCDIGESCGSCPGDCGSCPPGDPCGDGACDAAAGEGCSTCPADCGSCPPPAGCGDGACGAGESCSNCPADCGGCPTGCGDGTCDASEACDSCPADCGGCPPPPGCGNGICDGYPEDCGTCPGDCPCPSGLGCVARMCTCGDGACNGGEDCTNCPGDCGDCPVTPYCGDGACEPGVEDCTSCAGDCPCWMSGTTCDGAGHCVTYCGNGTCDADESCAYCPTDCGSCCGDGYCDSLVEDCFSCPTDCGFCPP